VSRIPAKEIERKRDEPGKDGKYISDSAGKGRVEKRQSDHTNRLCAPPPNAFHPSDAVFCFALGGAA